jgi:lipase chaperone LimK
MSDEEKVDLIDDMVKDVKNYTRAVTAIEETVDITSYNELRQKLISMEEDDLITNQVRQIYEQLGGKEIIERLLPDGGF